MIYIQAIGYQAEIIRVHVNSCCNHIIINHNCCLQVTKFIDMVDKTLKAESLKRYVANPLQLNLSSVGGSMSL